MENYPKPDILSLHTIYCMPQHVQCAVIPKINLTRQGPTGTKWQPTKDIVICNVHYAGFKGPNKDKKDVIPINFKRPIHYPSIVPASKRKEVTTRKQNPVPTLLCHHFDHFIAQADCIPSEPHFGCGEVQESSTEESSPVCSFVLRGKFLEMTCNLPIKVICP